MVSVGTITASVGGREAPSASGVEVSVGVSVTISVGAVTVSVGASVGAGVVAVTVSVGAAGVESSANAAIGDRTQEVRIRRKTIVKRFRLFMIFPF
jgi:hypothetical protein